jgi:hypothetical protein
MFSEVSDGVQPVKQSIALEQCLNDFPAGLRMGMKLLSEGGADGSRMTGGRSAGPLRRKRG